MNFTPKQLLIDTKGTVVTVKAVISMYDKNTKELIGQTIEVLESARKYQPSELSELTAEQYQEYTKHDEPEEL